MVQTWCVGVDLTMSNFLIQCEGTTSKRLFAIIQTGNRMDDLRDTLHPDCYNFPQKLWFKNEEDSLDFRDE